MNTYAFDVEIFQNFLSAIFVNVDNEFDTNVFVIFEDGDDSTDIIKFIERPITLCGYNNLYFDNVLLNALSEGYTCEQLFVLAQQIIRDENKDIINNLRRKKVLYKSIDFKELVGLDIGLKQAMVVLEWSKIQDLPLSFDTAVKQENVKTILDYNKNDVLPLVELWDKLQLDIKLRKKVNSLYKVNVTSKSEGQLPNIIFEKLYSEAVKRPIREIKQGRTPRERILLHDCLGKNIEFNSPELSGFLAEIRDFDLVNKLRRNIFLRGLTFNFGVGGLHTQDKAGAFYSTQDEIIIDADVTSFYPFIVINNRIKPEHLLEEFLTIFESMVKERTEAKAKKDKVKADILKISINAVFGKMGNQNYWFYDPQAFYSVTVSGQLYLLTLVERLILSGFEVISVNTDGIITKVKKSEEDKYYRVCKEWEELTKFSLDFSSYESYIRRDVNDYLAKGVDGKIKRKGAFVCKEDVSLYKRLSQSYSPDIIPVALTNYFVNKISVEQTIKSSRNIFDFLMSQRVDKKFKTIFRNGTDFELQHTNRWYAAVDGGTLIKKDDKREISILAGVSVQIANEIDPDQSFDDYGIDFKYYEGEVMKIINQIESPKSEQLQLF